MLFLAIRKQLLAAKQKINTIISESSYIAVDELQTKLSTQVKWNLIYIDSEILSTNYYDNPQTLTQLNPVFVFQNINITSVLIHCVAHSPNYHNL